MDGTEQCTLCGACRFAGTVQLVAVALDVVAGIENGDLVEQTQMTHCGRFEIGTDEFLLDGAAKVLVLGESGPRYCHVLADDVDAFAATLEVLLQLLGARGFAAGRQPRDDDEGHIAVWSVA